NAHARGIPVGMCGELAGDPLATVVLLGLGLDSFSMGPIGIPLIKRIVRSVGIMEAEAFVRGLMPMGSGAEIESAVRRWMEDRLEPILHPPPHGALDLRPRAHRHEASNERLRLHDT